MSLVTTLTTIVIHGFALIAVLHTVHREYLLGRAGTRFWEDVAIIAMVTQLALVAHLAEIALWAAVLILFGEFTRFAGVFYDEKCLIRVTSEPGARTGGASVRRFRGIPQLEVKQP